MTWRYATNILNTWRWTPSSQWILSGWPSINSLNPSSTSQCRVVIWDSVELWSAIDQRSKCNQVDSYGWDLNKKLPALLPIHVRNSETSIKNSKYSLISWIVIMALRDSNACYSCEFLRTWPKVGPIDCRSAASHTASQSSFLFKIWHIMSQNIHEKKNTFRLPTTFLWDFTGKGVGGHRKPMGYHRLWVVTSMV